MHNFSDSINRRRKSVKRFKRLETTIYAVVERCTLIEFILFVFTSQLFKQNPFIFMKWYHNGMNINLHAHQRVLCAFYR